MSENGATGENDEGLFPAACFEPVSLIHHAGKLHGVWRSKDGSR
jgi:hypothetical protein